MTQARSAAPHSIGDMSTASTTAGTATLAAEFRAAREYAALFERPDRALLIATGRDRRDWLHNLVTNAVKTLADGTGCYAFACDVRGRIQFDLNIFARPEALWLDVDAHYAPTALKHLERYLLSEDVRLTDVSAEYGRLGVCGPQAAALAARLGVADLAAIAPLAGRDVSVTPRADATRPSGVALPPDTTAERCAVPLCATLLRHDFAGVLGFELVVPAAQFASCRSFLAAQPEITPAGPAALEALRIDAGIPRLGPDFDATVVAPESGQVSRAINYHKGCYLGQEVIERMRSHGSLARRLVRLESVEPGHDANPSAAGTSEPTRAAAASLVLPATLLDGASEAGRITSLVAHPLGPRWIGLGYVRTRVSPTALLTAGDSPLRFRQRPDATTPELP